MGIFNSNGKHSFVITKAIIYIEVQYARRENCVSNEWSDLPMSPIEETLVEVFLDEASALETIMADLYSSFEKSFAEDAIFWKQLADEELNHAALIQNVKSDPEVSKWFVHDAPDDLVKETVKTMEWATSLVIKYSEEKPDRLTAFNTAIEVEKTAWELHYQSLMTKKSDKWFVDIVQELNNYDRDHLRRINLYIKEYNLVSLKSIGRVRYGPVFYI